MIYSRFSLDIHKESDHDGDDDDFAKIKKIIEVFFNVNLTSSILDLLRKDIVVDIYISLKKEREREIANVRMFFLRLPG